MKRYLIILAAFFLYSAFNSNIVFAESSYNYKFDSGVDTKETFGIPTTTEVTPVNLDMQNIRVNKDAALFPPSYGVFSGEIPTTPTSPYHNNEVQATITNVTNNSTLVDSYYNMPQEYIENTSLMKDQETYLTEPSYYSDGRIGTLKITRFGVSVKVYEGESLESMKKGAGHFEFTSNWDGNVGIAGHNRGSAGYFEDVKKLKIGDELVYTTKYGTRKYEVTMKEKISDTDYSYLGWSSKNMLTLITCVEGQSDKRWCVQAVEK